MSNLPAPISLRRSTRLTARQVVATTASVCILPETKPRGTQKEAQPSQATGDESDGGSTQDNKPLPTRVENKRRKRAKVEASDNSEYSEPKVKRPRKARDPKPEPVYIIPDVERKETTFRGRLGEFHSTTIWIIGVNGSHSGYACLNTVLRNKRPAHSSIFCSRTCRYALARL